MRKLKGLIVFLLIYGGVWMLLLIAGRTYETTSVFPLKLILRYLTYVLWLFVIGIPLVLWFDLWPKLKRKLFEKWKRDFEEEEKS